MTLLMRRVSAGVLYDETTAFDVRRMLTIG